MEVFCVWKRESVFSVLSALHKEYPLGRKLDVLYWKDV